MPTVLRTFPEVLRSGHQETTWSPPIPASIQFLQIESVASDAVHSDITNAMDFRIFVSPDGTDDNPLNKEVWLENWKGGAHETKPNPPGTFVPNKLDVSFGPMEQPEGPHYIGWRVKVGVDFAQPMVIGATVTALP